MNTQLRDKDIAILQAIHDGAGNTSEIKQSTTLTLREINYSLTEKSLEDMGLVDIERPEGRAWQKIGDHEKYVFKPKEVKLTDEGLQTLAHRSKHYARFGDVSKRELVERIQELENRQDRLETVVRDFREKVMAKL